MIKKLAIYICMFLVGMMGVFDLSRLTINEIIETSVLEVFADECTVGVDAGCTNSNPQIQTNGSVQGTQSQPTSSSQSAEMQKMLNSLLAGLNIFLAIVTIFVSPAIMFAGWLMSPDWTSGDLFGIRPVLHNLWVLVANITYFIYAILLIFIALATIFNSEKYGYKQLLPRLALGILLVPLTWWFVQFIVSLSSIVTTSVINLPTETLSTYIETKSTSGNKSWWDNKIIPKKIEFNNEYSTLKKNIETANCANSGDCLSPKDIISKSSGMYGGLLIYAYGVFKFSEVKELNTGTDVAKSIFSIINQGIVGVLMFLIFGLLVLALIFMLIMRAIKLWFYAIFSPLMTLKYVIGDGLFGGKEKSSSFDLKEFIGLAFVPALVGLSLSFGLVIITLLQTESKPGTTCTVAKIMGEGCKIIGIMGSTDNVIIRKLELSKGAGGGPGSEEYKSVNEIKIGEFTYRYVGSVVKGYQVDGAASEADSTQSALSSAGGIFGTIILDIIALMFIWLAFMAAKNVSKTVQAAIKPFEEFGNKIGGLASSLPKYAPILPGGLSMSSATKAVGAVEGSIIKADSDKFEKSSIGKMLSADKNISDDVAKKLITAIEKGDPKDFKELMNAYGGREMAWNSGAPKAMIDKLETLGNRSDRDAFLKRLEINDAETRKKILEFFEDGTKKSLHSDIHKKELMGLMNVGKSGGSSSTNTTAGAYTATKLVNDDKRMEVAIADVKMEMSLNGDAIKALSDEDKKKLKELMATVTKEEFKSRFSGISDGVKDKIIKEVEKDGRSFKSPKS